MADEKKRGKAASPATVKIREYLTRLPGEAFEKATIGTYRHATNQVTASAATFNQEKAKERKRRGFVSPRARKPRGASVASAIPAASAPAAYRSIRILASLPLTDYPDLKPAAVKALASDIVKQFHPGGQVVMLTDPPALEIRVPA